MLKLNKKMVILSFVITTSIVFGGWFLIQYLNTEKPIQQWFVDKEGVQLTDYEATRDALTIHVDFNNNHKFAHSFLELFHFLKETNPNKQVDISLNSNNSEQNEWWLKHSVPIYEAIKFSRFTDIEDQLNIWKENNKIQDGSIKMTQDYIFIYIKPQHEADIYLAIPYVKIKDGGLNG